MNESMLHGLWLLSLGELPQQPWWAVIPSWLWFGVLAAVGLPALVSAIVVQQVLKLSDPSNRVTPVSQDQASRRYVEVAGHHEWAKSEGLEWLGAYKHAATGPIFIAVWTHRSQPTYFLTYTHPTAGHFHDFVTLHEQGVVLTTASTKDGMLFPNAPGKFAQAFHGETKATLLRRHEEGLRYLREAFKARTLSVDLRTLKFEDVLHRAMLDQMAYVRGRPFWWARGAWWYFVRRGRVAGRTVQELVEAGVQRMNDGEVGER